MRKLLSIVLLLATPALLHAQTSVRGTVVDRQTGSPIAGATVEVAGTTVSTATDVSGAFTLTSDGQITQVTVAAVGYAATAVPVTDPAVHLYIRLAPSRTELPGVQVVARTPAPSVGILTRHDLERSRSCRVRIPTDGVGVRAITWTPGSSACEGASRM